MPESLLLQSRNSFSQSVKAPCDLHNQASRKNHQQSEEILFFQNLSDCYSTQNSVKRILSNGVINKPPRVIYRNWPSTIYELIHIYSVLVRLFARKSIATRTQNHTLTQQLIHIYGVGWLGRHPVDCFANSVKSIQRFLALPPLLPPSGFLKRTILSKHLQTLARSDGLEPPTF